MEMVRTIQLIINPKVRVVSLCGEPGIGKSTVARGVANYFNQRNFNKGVIFVPTINTSSLQNLQRRLVSTFLDSIG